MLINALEMKTSGGHWAGVGRVGDSSAAGGYNGTQRLWISISEPGGSPGVGARGWVEWNQMN